MSMEAVLNKAKQVKCLICDVDGVLTDGFLYLNDLGVESKAFSVQDGMGLKLLLSAGIEVAVITTANNGVIEHRMKQLGVKHYYKGQVEKETAYEQLKATLGLADDDFAYVGDDLPDLPIIRRVGFGVAVANAVRQVREFADWQTSLAGGQGAVRELCDMILTAQDKADAAIEQYLKR